MSMSMPAIGGPELLIILLVVLVLFGGSRLATFGQSIGGAFRGFKEGLTGEAPAAKAPPEAAARAKRR
jgi:sec-independent protein translocase protein TatA